MRDNVVPEDKLLKLIRGGQKKQGLGAVSEPINLKPAHPIAQSMPQPSGNIFSAQNIIFVILSIAVILLIISLLYPMFGPKEIVLPAATKEVISLNKSDANEDAKPYEFYLEGVKSRQIFSSTAAISAQAEPSDSIGPTRVDIDLMKDMNLVGVVSGDNPQAIIEDKKAQKTYYLSKGQFIGELQVEDIQDGKVILTNKGQRFELHL